MQQIKLFKSIESELEALEAEMNTWIRESGIKVLSVTGNIAPQTGSGVPMGSFSASDVLIIVVYEDGKN
ncbi:MAG: hypothetical protein U0892_15750 [Pirellulales bacterium]